MKRPKTPAPPTHCPRCRLQLAAFSGDAEAKRKYRYLRHTRFGWDLRDPRALAQFFEARPDVLAHDVIVYRQHPESAEPVATFTSGFPLLTYVLWADDHGIGHHEENTTLVHAALDITMHQGLRDV